MREQKSLIAGFRTLEARASQRSAEIAYGSDLILGFIQRVKLKLDFDCSLFYFPSESDQIACVYQTIDQNRPTPLEYKGDLKATRRKVITLLEGIQDTVCSPQIHPGLNRWGNNIQNDLSYQSPVINLVLDVLGGYLPGSYPQGAISLTIDCSIPEELKSSTSRLKELTGFLLLLTDKNSLQENKAVGLGIGIHQDFDEYVETIGRHTAVHDLEFFISSLLHQDERVQDDTNRALGLITHLIAHRMKNLRQAAMLIVQFFPTEKDVNASPEKYRTNIKMLSSQMEKAEQIEKQLEFLSNRPAKDKRSIPDLVDILRSRCDKCLTGNDSPIQLDLDIPVELENVFIWAPALLPEVFNNHFENFNRVFDNLELKDKRLLVHIYTEAQFVCIDIIHYGPPIPSQTLEDMQRVVRVRKPIGAGMGMFLSGMILRHVGGSQEVTSPLIGSDHGACVKLSFPIATE
ncbi:MAG: hypothetical protein WCK35_04840 [Chloroflexota bacterium]